jgi:hypothetical protein
MKQSFTFALDPFHSGESTLYDIELSEIDSGLRNCRFVLDISESEPDQSPMSSAPIYGWATWNGRDLAMAFMLSESGDVGVSRSVVDRDLPDDELDDAGAHDLAHLIAEAVLTGD